MQALKLLLAAAAAALALTEAATTTKPKVSNNTMSVGDGTTVKTNGTTTVFFGTEYNPGKCKLQFQSLKCTSSKDCAELNGYKLECVLLGVEDNKEKRTCQCPANVDATVCQNTTAPGVDGIKQFGDCSGGKQCVDSYGHVPSKLELRICAEKLHCVKEINTTASKPAEICHTCRSCIAQNDPTNSQLTDKRRFDCRKICPKEILDSLEKRNKDKVDIAGELSSEEASGSGAKEESSGSTSTTGSAGKDKTSGSKPADKKSAAVPSVSMVSVPMLVASVVGVSLSAALLH